MPAAPRHYTDGITVLKAIGALDSVFSKFDREEYAKIIDKAIEEKYLSVNEEKKAYKLPKKYKKQLKTLNIDFDEIGHIPRADNETDIGDIIKRIPQWIEQHHFKTVSDTERLYHYDHGVYLDDGEKVLKEIIEVEFGEVTTNKMVLDVIGKVKRRTYVVRDAFNSRPMINVRNGLLDLDILELFPHTPDYLSTAQLDVTYEPRATAPKIQKFQSEVAIQGRCPY
jgi:phage/plasmid-associated DNA primase